jgi:hypothetical protein
MKPSLVLLFGPIACTKTNDKNRYKNCFLITVCLENLKSIFKIVVHNKMGFPSVSFCLSYNASKPWPKSIPNNPNAGINTRNPTPAERLNANGLYFWKP